jgi:hypothetical protein
MLRSGSVGIVLLCFASVAAQAAPVSSVRVVTDGVSRYGALIEKAASRRCWKKGGKTECAPARRAAPQDEGYGLRYGQPRPEDLRFGSAEWWRAMDRERRGGFAGDT